MMKQIFHQNIYKRLCFQSQTKLNKQPAITYSEEVTRKKKQIHISNNNNYHQKRNLEFNQRTYSRWVQVGIKWKFTTSKIKPPKRSESLQSRQKLRRISNTLERRSDEFFQACWEKILRFTGKVSERLFFVTICDPSFWNIFVFQL